MKAIDRPFTKIINGTTQFVAVGDDGTVHVLVNALMELRSDHRFTVAVVPSGSGSDLTRTFGHKNDLESAFDRLASPELYGLDIGRISSATFTKYLIVPSADEIRPMSSPYSSGDASRSNADSRSFL